MNTTYNIRSVA